MCCEMLYLLDNGIHAKTFKSLELHTAQASTGEPEA